MEDYIVKKNETFFRVLRKCTTLFLCTRVR